MKNDMSDLNNKNYFLPIVDPYHPRWTSQMEYCQHTKKLMDKIEEIRQQSGKEVDVYLILKAVFYAKFYHAGQSRKSGEPYYTHPLEVAYMVLDYLFRTDIIISAILHDTVEDTSLTLEMIERSFGGEIANQVRDLTRIHNDKKISAAQVVEYLLEDRCHDVLVIKMLDRLHNLMTINAKPTESIKRTVEETLHAFVVLAAYLGMKNIEKKMALLCYECLEKGLINDMGDI